MPTLTTSYQYIGASPDSGPNIMTSGSYASKLYLQAKIKSYNANNVTITARASIRNSWVSWSSYNVKIALTGENTHPYVNAGSSTVWSGANSSSGSSSYKEVWSDEYSFNVSYKGSFSLGLSLGKSDPSSSAGMGYTATVSKQTCYIPSKINSFTGNNLNSTFSVAYIKSSSAASTPWSDKLRISIPNVVSLETFEYTSGTSFSLTAASLDYIRNYMTQHSTNQVTLGAVIETWNGSTKVSESAELTNVCTFAALAPSYNSINASQIGSTSARLAASVNDNGATITSGGWQLSTNSGTNWTTYTGDWELMSFFNLTRATTYTYRGFATNSIGTTYSSTSTFTTLAEAPSYNSITATNITQTGVTLTAIIDNGGSAITAGGFQLSVDGGSTWTSYAGSETSQTITGLTPNTTYTYRGYATNAIDTTYSSSNTFTTSADSNIYVSVNGATFVRAKMKVSINGGSFVDLSSDVKTSINGNPFN